MMDLGGNSTVRVNMGEWLRANLLKGGRKGELSENGKRKSPKKQRTKKSGEKLVGN